MTNPTHPDPRGYEDAVWVMRHFVTENTKENEMTFETWLSTIDTLADAEGARCQNGRSYTEMTGRECWQEAFADGLSPGDAWFEEKLAGIS